MAGLPRCYPEDPFDEEGEAKANLIAELRDKIREADTHARLASVHIVKPRKDAYRERVRLEMALEDAMAIRTEREKQREDWRADHNL